MFAQLEGFLESMDLTDNSARGRSPQSENYIRKLTSLSRYVTPCPDILDDVGHSNNHPTNNLRTSPFQNVKQAKSLNQSTSRNSTIECTESSDSSDESAWESLQIPRCMGALTRQWKNLIEYEDSLPENHIQQSNNSAANPVETNHMCLSRETPQTTTQPNLQNQDVVEILNTIAKSLEKLGGHSCENTTNMFGQYIAHRLSQLSDESRSAAEMEINQVLMKYVAKEIQADRPSSAVQETRQDNKSSRHKGKKRNKV